MKKHRKLIVLIIIIIVLVGVTIVGKKVYKEMNEKDINNIFDEMYYVGEDNVSAYWHKDVFKSVSKESNRAKGTIDSDGIKHGLMRVYNKSAISPALKEYGVESIIVYFDYDPFLKIITSIDRGEGSDDSIIIRWIYNVESDEMELEFEFINEKAKFEPMTGKDIDEFLASFDMDYDELYEVARMFLYDQILIDYLEGNEKLSKFSMDDLGDVDILGAKVVLCSNFLEGCLQSEK
ncbi:hypothetical protein M2475_002073 [Breznakia sp. PF5-3]|uniref:TipC family immunity protein n=1 Tax=unclassified Breznakia TaxID=2623764 RepID=UPI002405E5AA|nr:MULTISPECIES: TipC family immunity protein [unclassified Breznakia]MDF9825668.1 hypothetical protein [Breznakia sp. PM6-1]MDF9836492.1 hypothetical protein [Breznakia sp. PF5-3]MDF9838637.1 hypothetical protein [Breznakia sp. PFB2-8]MDF9860668.1 hypothetical protein [Breznakia sp. PH5-24]